MQVGHTRNSAMFVAACIIFGCLLPHLTLTAGAGFSCVEETTRCVESREAVISRNIAAYHFKDACKYYKEALDCLHDLSEEDLDCKPINFPAAFTSAKEKAFEASNDMCGVDGSISGCAYDFTKCMLKVQDIRDALKSDQQNTSCRAYIEFSDCSELIKDRMECPANMENILTKLVVKYKKDLAALCFKTCDVALDLCVSDVPLNLTHDSRISEEDEEILCAELETAMDCMNATDVNILCAREQETDKWTEALNTQKGHYEEFCSISAKTCVVELDSCATGVDAAAAANAVSSPEDVKALCRDIENAAKCVNRMAEAGFCKGEEGAKIRADTLNRHMNDLDTYCGVRQCQLAFPSCFDLITEVRGKVVDMDPSLECHDVKLAMSCASHMEKFDPCLSLEFGNNTFEGAMTVLSDLESSLCGVSAVSRSLSSEMTQCETLFPQCYKTLVHAESEVFTCSQYEERHKCARTLSISLACRNSKHAEMFAYVLKTESIYMLQHCSGVASRNSLMLILTTLMVSWILSKS